MSTASGPSIPPVEIDDAALELLLTRAAGLSLESHVEAMRLLYRLAVYDEDEQGILVENLATAYPCRARAYSPMIATGWLKTVIRTELGLRTNKHVTKETVQEWVRRRNRAVTRGERSAPFSEAELAVLAPRWAVEVLVACLAAGPSRIRTRVESWGTDYANGKLGVRSTKTAAEHSRTVPAPKTVDGVRETLGGFFKLGTTALREKYIANLPIGFALGPAIGAIWRSPRTSGPRVDAVPGSLSALCAMRSCGPTKSALLPSGRGSG